MWLLLAALMFAVLNFVANLEGMDMAAIHRKAWG